MNDVSETAKPIVIEAWRDELTGGVQLSIGEAEGHGYRLAGPKFLGASRLLRSHQISQRDADEIRSYLDAVFPPVAWWIKAEGDPFDRDPELYATEHAAKDEAIRSYREANDLTDDYLGWLGNELPNFAWREHREGGSELYVDAEASGLIVRKLAVRNAAKAVAA